MRIHTLRAAALGIPFKVAFRHSSADRAETSTLWVEARSAAGSIGYGESCPRPYVTGETVETAEAFAARHDADLRASAVDLVSLRAWMDAHAGDIDANPAAWCALELAVLDLMAKDAGVPIEAFLSRPPLAGRFQYTAVLGDSGSRAFEAMAGQYAAMGFRDFKIKLSGDLTRDREKIAALDRLEPAPSRLRADANNLWSGADEAATFLRGLGRPFFALEEPIGAGAYGELSAIGRALGCRIVLDESVLRIDQLEQFRDDPGRWLVNVRVSKMGGLLRSLAIVESLRAAGIGIIVGAQVGETSLLTRAGLVAAQAAGDALVAQEGAFGTLLLERDVCDPPLMFGSRGVLDVSTYPLISARPGFGLEIVTDV